MKRFVERSVHNHLVGLAGRQLTLGLEDFWIRVPKALNHSVKFAFKGATNGRRRASLPQHNVRAEAKELDSDEELMAEARSMLESSDTETSDAKVKRVFHKVNGKDPVVIERSWCEVTGKKAYVHVSVPAGCAVVVQLKRRWL